MKELIGFIGVIGSGKNYQKDLLLKQGYAGIDFKDELIAVSEDLLGFEITSKYDLFKETVVGVTKPGVDMSEDVMRRVSNRFLAQFPNAMTGRSMLQRMGTEVMRKRDPDYWVKAWARKAVEALKGGRGVACADVRFRNEIEALWGLGKELGVKSKIIFCDFHSDRYNEKSPHESERLAQHLLAEGLKDGDQVLWSHLPIVIGDPTQSPNKS